MNYMKLRKAGIFVVMALLLSVLPVSAWASGDSVALAEIPETTQGGTVIFTGTTTMTEVNIKVLRPNGSVLYFNIVPSAGGTFSDTIIVGNVEPTGTYQVAAGQGTDVDIVTFEVKAADPGGGDPGSGNPGGENGNETSQPGTVTGQPAGTAVVHVNGQAVQAGTAVTETVGGRMQTTVVLDAAVIEQQLAVEGEGEVISIAVNTGVDVLVGELNVQMVQSMQPRKAVLEIRTENAAYRLPAELIDIEALSNQFGTDVSLGEIKFRLEIARPTSETVQVVENAVAEGGFSLVVPPLEFTVRSTYGDKVMEITDFTSFVERMIAIPEGVDPSRITTAIVVEKDGSVRHVPTQVIEVDGQYFAKVNSLTNSTYSVVWNPVSFVDMEGHWSKDVVNDMGSRMIVGGGDGLFHPEREITRAEFAAIVVRGLGLRTGGGQLPFSDVQMSDWYHGVIAAAYQYELINGYADGTFRPNDTITREQAMAIIARAMQVTELQAESVPTNPLRSFLDAGDVSDWAVDVIAETLQAGIVTGRTTSELAPKASVTRAEVAVMVQRLLKRSDLI